MNVIVIGASGFLGNVLCRLLHKKDYTVTALALDATTAISLQDLSIKKINATILDKKSLSNVLQNQDIVFNLAGTISILKDRTKCMYAVNVKGVKNVAEAALAANVRKFIHVSSIHAFHRYPEDQAIDENRPLALTEDEYDYDRTKALGEVALLEVMAKGLNAVIINPTCFIGPYDFEPSLMGSSINNFFAQKILPSLSGGFNFLDVRDMAQTLINTIEHGKNGERYLVAGEWISVNDMIDVIIQLRGFSGVKMKIPSALLYIQAYLQVFYATLFNTKKIPFSNQSLGHLKFHRFITDDKAREVLQHQNRPLAETLRDANEWNKQRISGAVFSQETQAH